MPKTYTLVPVHGSIGPLTIQDGEDELRALQLAVGGFIESAPTHSPLYSVLCNANETGELHPVSDYNTRISSVLGYSIVGDVVVVGAADDDGETADFFPASWEALASLAAGF